MNYENYLQIYLKNLFSSRRSPQWNSLSFKIRQIATQNEQGISGIKIVFHMKLKCEQEICEYASHVFVSKDLAYKSLNYWKRNLSLNLQSNEEELLEATNLFYDFCSRYILLSCYTAKAQETDLGISLEVGD